MRVIDKRMLYNFEKFKAMMKSMNIYINRDAYNSFIESADEWIANCSETEYKCRVSMDISRQYAIIELESVSTESEYIGELNIK